MAIAPGFSVSPHSFARGKRARSSRRTRTPARASRSAATLPAGPFLAYDHQGALVSSIYMIPLKDLTAHKAFTSLDVARERADHVDIVFNAGHPGVAEPHYHVIVWYVSPQRAARLAK